MKKRLLTILITSIMVICAIPMSASAVMTPVVIGGNMVDNSGDVTGTGITGSVQIQYYDANGTEVIDGDDADHAIITLGDCTITNAADPCIICSIPTEIILNGNSVVKDTDDYAIAANSSLKISGSGLLNIENATTGILVSESDLIIDGATINTTNISMCALAADNITFNGVCNAKLTSNSYATVYAQEEIIFNLTGGQIEAKSDGQYAFLAASDETIIFKNGKSNYSITSAKGANGDMIEEGNAWFSANADRTASAYALVKYNTPETHKKGANTGDSNNIALYSIVAILALCGAGFVHKRREN